MGNDCERGIVGSLRQTQQRFPDLAGCMQLWSCKIKPPQAEQNWGQLWRLTHLLTQRTGLGVGVRHLRCCMPFRHLQRCAEGNVQGQGVLETLGFRPTAG